MIARVLEEVSASMRRLVNLLEIVDRWHAAGRSREWCDRMLITISVEQTRGCDPWQAESRHAENRRTHGEVLDVVFGRPGPLKH